MVDHLHLASDRESLDATEPEHDGYCERCGHAYDLHRTANHRCTAEVPNVQSECPLCGGKLLAGWTPGEPDRCSGCGGRVLNTAACGCDLSPRVVA